MKGVTFDILIYTEEQLEKIKQADLIGEHVAFPAEEMKTREITFYHISRTEPVTEKITAIIQYGQEFLVQKTKREVDLIIENANWWTVLN